MVHSAKENNLNEGPKENNVLAIIRLSFQTIESVLLVERILVCLNHFSFFSSSHLHRI